MSSNFIAAVLAFMIVVAHLYLVECADKSSNVGSNQIAEQSSKQEKQAESHAVESYPNLSLDFEEESVLSYDLAISPALTKFEPLKTPKVRKPKHP